MPLMNYFRDICHFKLSVSFFSFHLTGIDAGMEEATGGGAPCEENLRGKRSGHLPGIPGEGEACLERVDRYYYYLCLMWPNRERTALHALSANGDVGTLRLRQRERGAVILIPKYFTNEYSFLLRCRPQPAMILETLK